MFRLYQELSNQVHELEEARRELQQRVMTLESENERNLRMALSFANGSQRLAEQIVALDITPAWHPSQAELRFAQEHMQSPVARRWYAQPEVLIWQNLGAYFDENELRSLAFELGIDYENIPGTIKEAKAQGLTEKMRRLGRLDELVERAKVARPNLVWPKLV